MKNILVVSHGAALGGSPISALNIARNINNKKFKVVYAFGEAGPVAELARTETYPVHIIPKSGSGLRTILAYRALIKTECIDVIHLNTLTSYYKYPGIAAWLSRKPVVWFVRENPEEKRCVRLRHYVHHIADKVVTVSDDTAAHMPYVQKSKLLTIHNGIDLDAFSPSARPVDPASLGLPPGKYLTTVASLEPRKGVLDLIEAFSKVADALSDTQLLIVGTDRSPTKTYLRHIQERIRTTNLKGRIFLLGEHEDITQVLAITHCFIMPSYWEGLSRSILEAMACGKAIIASNNGGNKEQVLNGVNGFTFTAGDIETLADLLLKTQDTELMQAMGRASRSRAEQHFPIKATNAALEMLYTSLV